MMLVAFCRDAECNGIEVVRERIRVLFGVQRQRRHLEEC